MTKYQQLELWNDTPEPWIEKMKRDAFELAFPSEDDDVGEDDLIEVHSSWEDAQESWGCGEGTCYQEGQDARFWFEVEWWKQPIRNNGLALGRRYVFRHRRFSGADAVKFFQQLMEKGSQ